MTESRLAEDIRQFLNFERVDHPVAYTIQETNPFYSYTRERIMYEAVEGDEITAFLLTPAGDGPFPAIILHHQHAGQRHLGKSEVVGLAGDPLMAFGPKLAQQGYIVLAPDSICFEDRRKNATGIEPRDDDALQHFIEMGHRVALGDTLMRKVLSDASVGLSLLAHHPNVNKEIIGAVGHSYGGSTALFQTALEPRITFAVSSGALSSYACKREHGTGLEMSLIIPGFAARWEMHHLLDCIAPRPLLILSADEDPYARDAPDVIASAQFTDNITHFRDHGTHTLTPERVKIIMDYIGEQNPT